MVFEVYDFAPFLSFPHKLGKVDGLPKPIIMVGILETTHIQTRAIGGVKRGNSA